jgi:hypothetical protein
VFDPARSDADPDNDGAVGRRHTYRVFLPAGAWAIRLDGDGVAGGRVRVAALPLARSQAGTLQWQTPTSGWQLLEISGDAAMTLRRIRFERVSDGTGAR